MTAQFPLALQFDQTLTLEDSLDRLEAIEGQIAQAALRGERGAAIVSLRYDFATECGNLLLTMCEDARVFDDRELFEDMQTALDALRTRATNHQLRWQGERIDADPAGYRAAAEQVHLAVLDFIARARASLDG